MGSIFAPKIKFFELFSKSFYDNFLKLNLMNSIKNWVKKPADLVTFTEEILNVNFIFCAVRIGEFGSVLGP